MSQKEVYPHRQKQRPQEATWDGVTLGCWSRAEAAGGMLGGYQLDTMGPCSVRSK